jgi:Uma2 family endonuclease
VAIANALAEGQRKAGGSCLVLFAPLDVYLGDSVVQPDLVIICDESKVSKRGIDGPPEVVVEILSPRTAIKDLNRKWWLYEAAGVPEYLIIDPDEKVGRLLRLVHGLYVEAARVSFGALVPLCGGKLPVILA